MLVALAGPLTSLIVGLLFAFLLNFIPPSLFLNNIAVRIPQLVLVFASVNICLAIFNIIPLYPLDGYQIVYTLLPSRQAVQFAKSAPYGPFIILAIFFLLPFLAVLARLPILNIPQLILSGSLGIISLLAGHLPGFIDIADLYRFFVFSR
jgi:Zn-dependent protease